LCAGDVDGVERLEESPFCTMIVVAIVVDIMVDDMLGCFCCWVAPCWAKNEKLNGIAERMQSGVKRPQRSLPCLMCDVKGAGKEHGSRCRRAMFFLF
jgi:hypothetical protein